MATDIHAEQPVRWPGWVPPRGRVAVVTGAGSGIGQATSILAAQQGVKVAAWDLNREGAERTLRRAGGYADSIIPIIADVADSAAVEQATRDTSQQVGTPTLLVNNAGPTILGGALGFSAALDAAVGSVQKVTEAFLAAEPGPGASVVNISALAGPIAGGTTKGLTSSNTASGAPCGATGSAPPRTSTTPAGSTAWSRRTLVRP